MLCVKEREKIECSNPDSDEVYVQGFAEDCGEIIFGSPDVGRELVRSDHIHTIVRTGAGFPNTAAKQL